MENLNLKLDITQSLPKGFLTIDPRDAITVMPNPTLIELKSSSDKPPLFVSTLLHGNETTGFYALQRLLNDYHASKESLPRDLIIFIGNVFAARKYQRRLDGQVDYNRIWAGGLLPEHAIAKKILDYLRHQAPFACIDIHNNTGRSPFYGCINDLKPSSINLAKLFSNNIVYFTRPHETLSVALNQFTTALTIESGRSGETGGIERVYQFLKQVINLTEIETVSLDNNDVNMFHSIARIFFPLNATVAFSKSPLSDYDFTFIETIERLNFVVLAENTCIGWRNSDQFDLMVVNEEGKDVSEEMFCYNKGEIRVKRPVVPAMFCTCEKIIRQDCFGYFMQQYTID